MSNGETYNPNLISESIDNANHIAIVPSRIAGPDAFCAAVGLYYMLLEREKQVSFIYPGRVPEVCSKMNLINLSEINADTSSRRLLVSIDYSGTPAAKVQYSTEDNVLHLVISPISNDFDSSRVKANIAGFDFDVVFMLGVQSITDLGRTYTDLQEEFRSSQIVNMDNTDVNTRHGHVNVIDTSVPNLSTLIFRLASKLELTPNSKASRALLVGMTYKEPLS
jgi:nanoRNase/pAp phosphatase (c-di-AMP/oligoRNAs hydrolase)